MASTYPSLTNGIGTKIYYWPVGKITKRAEFPMKVRAFRHGGITTPSIDTTHLSSPIPAGGREFGGRTMIPGKLKNPGQVTLEGFLNPQAALPQGEFFLQVIFPRAPTYVTTARWFGIGHLSSLGDISITIDEAMMQTVIFQFSGIVVMVAAKKN